LSMKDAAVAKLKPATHSNDSGSIGKMEARPRAEGRAVSRYWGIPLK
jgi:hypothetical protein